MVFKWKKQSDEIARVISKKDVGGIFSKSVIISPNEKAAIIKNGVVEEIIDSGKVRVGGILKGDIGKDVDIALMDTSPKDLEWISGEMWTSDDQKVGCSGLLRFRMQDPKKFFQMLFAYTTPDKKGERALSVHDIYNRLESETITRVLEPEIRDVRIENIYGNRELQLKIENELEMQLKSTLSMWGLELLKYTVEWDLGVYEEVMEASREFQTRDELKEMETLEVESDLERAAREEVARVKAGLAPEAVAKEYERGERVKGAKLEAELTKIEGESDAEEARRAIETFQAWKGAKTGAKRAELELEEDMAERKHARDMEYVSKVTEKGGHEAAKIIAQGRELESMSPEQIEALAKMREADARAKEEKVEFMKEVEDRERKDSYRHKELDAEMMGAAHARRMPGVRKCPYCGTTVPAEANFCGQCGKKLE